MLNLKEYIQSGFFITDRALGEQYDLIIFESFDIKKYGDKPEDIETLDAFDYDFGVGGLLAAKTKNFESILIVIDKINVVYLLPFLQKFKNKEITIINTSVGVSSYISKTLPETSDITLVNTTGLTVYEPADQQSFLELLKYPNSSYIRVADKDYPEMILDNMLTGNQVLVKGDATTLLAGGTLIPDLLAHPIPGAELLSLINFTDPFTIDLVQSIQKTSKLVVVVDHQDQKSLKNIIEAGLYQNSLQDVEIHFITPSYEKINTILRDYIYEQADFDGEKIGERVGR